MKKRTNFYTTSLTIALLVFSAVLFIKYYEMKEYLDKYDIAASDYLQRNDSLLIEYKKHLDLTYSTSENDFNHFANELSAKYDLNGKLVFFFRYDHCGSCVARNLTSLDIFLSSNKVSKKDIVLIAENWKENPFEFEIMKDYKDNYKCVFLEESDKTFKMLDEWPFYFIARENNSFSTLFIPDLLPFYKDNYFSKIIPNIIDINKRQNTLILNN